MVVVTVLTEEDATLVTELAAANIIGRLTMTEVVAGLTVLEATGVAGLIELAAALMVAVTVLTDGAMELDDAM